MAIKRPYQMKTISSNLFVIDRKSYQRKKDNHICDHIFIGGICPFRFMLWNILSKFNHFHLLYSQGG